MLNFIGVPEACNPPPVCPAEQPVDVVDDPVKQPAVEGLGHGVPGTGRPLHGVAAADQLTPRHHGGAGQRLRQLEGVHA